MQIQTYISDLLYRYDCVTVPEFGSFVTQKVSAQLNNSTQTFTAPKKNILFNEQIKINDGLLARYIADVEKIPFETANIKISNQVKRFKSQLVEGDCITLNTIGDLQFNENSKIVFTPSQDVNYLSEAFGLQNIIASHVDRTERTILKDKQITATTNGSGTSKNYLKYAAVGLVALTLGGLVGGKWYTDKIKTHNQVVLDQANTALESKIQEATFIISNPLPTVTFKVEKKVIGSYHVIAGAYRIEENSITKIKELKTKGFNAHKIGLNKYGLHEVAYQSYSDKNEAINALNRIKKSENSNAWLLVKTLD